MNVASGMPLGIMVGGFSLESSNLRSNQHQRDFQVTRHSEQGTPPVVLLPRLAGEPPRIDLRNPRHPRGTGDLWPPESVISDSGNDPRLSLIAAWRMLGDSTNRTIQWDTGEGLSQPVSGAEAIASAVATCLPQRGNGCGQPVLVIPNRTRMDRQQELIDAARGQGIDLALLWRPVAAALSWLEFYKDVLDLPADHATSGPLRLLTLHLGIDECELTMLELVNHEFAGEFLVVPARGRPSKDSWLPSFGLEAYTRLCGLQSESELFRSGSLQPVLLGLRSGQIDFRDAFGQSGSARAGGEGLPQELASFVDWLDRHRLETRELIGVVITGELASLPYRGHPFGMRILKRLTGSSNHQRLLLEGLSPQHEMLLARGAAVHAAGNQIGEVSYLDTLPRIQTAVSILGQLNWIHLLNPTDSYVPGGKTWRRSAPLRGLKVQEGRQELEIVLHHEEYETVRMLTAQFSSPMNADVPVRLEVSVQSAQGNAHVDVVPEQSHASLKTIRLNWKQMADQGQSADEWVQKQPTIFPPLLKRAASLGRWQVVRPLLQRVVAATLQRNVPEITQELQRKDPNPFLHAGFEGRMTAVGSEGEAPQGDTPLLEEFVKLAMTALLRPRCSYKDDLVRMLSYSSTTNADFLEYLSKRISEVGSDLAADEVKACGACLRDPQVIHQFAVATNMRLQNPTAINFWLKAFSDILRYRDDATREIPSELCESLSRRMLQVFRQELDARKAKYLFRYSSLGIVYLLRRRAYDDGYLSIGSPIYMDVRSAFSEAMLAFKKGKLSVIGGAIQLDTVLQTMIDYIDRKGASSLSADADLQSLIS